MRLTIRPLLSPDRELDVTEPVLRAIAGSMADQFGGNEQLNLLEAEFHLERMLGTHCVLGALHASGGAPA